MFWSGTPAREVRIAAYEAANGFTFPAEYRTFLATANGGVPLGDGVPQSDDENVAARLFELDASAEESNLWSAQLRYASRVPLTLMPIGIGTGGNLLCLGVFGAARGRVFSSDLRGATRQVASSFTELLAIADAARSA